MTRRTLSSIVACVLLVGLFAVAALLPVPYVTMSPGPTVDVLAEQEGEEIIQIAGEETFDSTGSLSLTTVSVTGPDQELTLAEAVTAWFDRTRAVLPRDVIYDPEQSPEEVETESSVQMVSSQDTAIAVALRELGYEVPAVTEVLAVNEGAPADGELEVRDKILSVNGTEVADAAAVARAVRATGVGNTATFVVRRDGETRTVDVTTGSAEDDPGHAVVGIVVGEGYQFPFDVTLKIDEAIGGPSAGLVFALGVFDSLTEGELTGGAHVAGTGTIASNGSVGPIGGIQQKIVAAADNGAELFLVPPGNCPAALEAPVDPEEIELVKARTMHTAVESIEAYVEGDLDALPRC